MDETFALVQSEDVNYDQGSLLKPLMSARGLVRLDALQFIKHNPRIFLERLPLEQAQAMAAAFGEAGIPCWVIPAARVVQMGKPVTVYNADCEDRLYVHLDYSAQRTALPWDSLALVSAAPVQIVRTVKQVKRGGFSRARHSSEGAPPPPEYETKTRTERALLLDLFAVTDASWHLRIRANEFNYDYLGKRLRPVSADNFRLLLDDVIKAAKHAHIPPATHALLRAEPGKPVPNEALFDALNRWQLQRIVELSKKD